MSGLQKSGRLVENYIFQIDRIFCSKDIRFATGIPYNSVFNNIRRLKKEGKIIPISGHQYPTFYRYVGRSGMKEKKKEQIKRLIIIVNRYIDKMWNTPLDDAWDQLEEWRLI